MGLFEQWTLPSLPHLWTIAVEEQFYVLAPFMYWALRSPYWRQFVFGVLIFSNVGRTAYIVFSDPVQGYRGGLYYLTFTYADTFVVGALIAKRFTEGWRPALASQVWCFWIAAALLTLAAWIWASSVFAPYPWYAPISYALPALACGLLLISILPGHWSILYWLLTRPLMVYLGKMSYGLYLYHLLVLNQVSSLSEKLSVLQYNAVVLSCCVVYAQLSYHLIEDRFRRAKDSPYIREILIKYPLAPIITLGAMLIGIARLFA
jgi:peptidoglycan/LPS O-acetylase OafA/YrhL